MMKMPGYDKTFKLFAFVFIVLTISNCSSIRESWRTGGVESLTPADFAAEIARQEAIVGGQSGLSERTKAHLKLAKLYSHHNNPAPNYQKALSELEIYIAFDPEGGKQDEIQNLLALLKKIDLLTKENLRAKDENQKMKGIIEDLKHLDIQLEKKRKQY